MGVNHAIHLWIQAGRGGAASQHRQDIFRRHARHVSARRVRGRAGMRRNHDIVQRAQAVRHPRLEFIDIEADPGDIAVFQRPDTAFQLLAAPRGF